MKRVAIGGCTVPLADWPLFHCRTGSRGGGGGWRAVGTATY